MENILVRVADTLISIAYLATNPAAYGALGGLVLIGLVVYSIATEPAD